MLPPPVLSAQTYSGHFYFLWFFLFSLHLVADQIGAAPITCQRNVPALPSITGSARARRAAACSRPERAPEAAAHHRVNRLGFARACARRARAQINAQVCMFTRHRRSQRFHHVTRHVLPCSAAYVMSAA